VSNSFLQSGYQSV